jgi:hypothetical protein
MELDETEKRVLKYINKPYCDSIVVSEICGYLWKGAMTQGDRNALTRLMNIMRSAMALDQTLTLDQLVDMDPGDRPGKIQHLGEKGNNDWLTMVISEYSRLSALGKGEGEGGAVVNFGGDGEADII